MDEKVTANLGFFFTSTPFACSYNTFTCPHHFFPDNKLPSKLASNVPSKYLKILLFVL